MLGWWARSSWCMCREGVYVSGQVGGPWGGKVDVLRLPPTTVLSLSLSFSFSLSLPPPPLTNNDLGHGRDGGHTGSGQ